MPHTLPHALPHALWQGTRHLWRITSALTLAIPCYQREGMGQREMLEPPSEPTMEPLRRFHTLWGVLRGSENPVYKGS